MPKDEGVQRDVYGTPYGVDNALDAARAHLRNGSVGEAVQCLIEHAAGQTRQPAKDPKPGEPGYELVGGAQRPRREV